MPAGLIEIPAQDRPSVAFWKLLRKRKAKSLPVYLAERYGDKFDLLRICPMEFPVPFGVAPLADIPESENSGLYPF